MKSSKSSRGKFSIRQERLSQPQIKMNARDRIYETGMNTLAVLIILVILYPLWFIIIASFSNPADVSNGNVLIIPKSFTLDGYKEILKQGSIWIGYRNTIVYTILGTIITLVVNLPAAYALSRRDLVGRKFLMMFFIIPMFFSGGLIPTYFIVKDFGLLDSFWVMILPFSVVSYYIIVARTFFSNNLPDSLWEAAQIDGCGNIRFFLQMVLPLSRAILAVIALWTAVGHWNSWFNALIYLRNDDLKPLQLVLRGILIGNQSLLTSGNGEAAAAMRRLADLMKYAVIIVSTVPIMLFYPFVQKHFNQGVMIGAMKE